MSRNGLFKAKVNRDQISQMTTILTANSVIFDEDKFSWKRTKQEQKSPTTMVYLYILFQITHHTAYRQRGTFSDTD